MRTKKQNDAVEKQLLALQRQDAEEAKLLLLGAAESGKSTIFKQAQIIHDNGFTQTELASFKEVIYANVLCSVRDVLIAMREFRIAFHKKSLESIAQNLVFMDEMSLAQAVASFGPTIASELKRLWVDPGMQAALAMRDQFQLIDSAEYFLEEIDRLAAPDYCPTEQDVLRARLKTTSIVERTFAVDGHAFRFVDVGGQRNERRKWIHCFDNVTAVIFVVAMSEFDQVLMEDNITNRMHESLTLWDSIVNHECFTHTPIILFLNKMDLFESKVLRGINLQCCFPEYTGGANVQEAKRFILEKFVLLNRYPGRKIYPHFITATDTTLMRKIFDDVKAIVLIGNLQQADLVV